MAQEDPQSSNQIDPRSSSVIDQPKLPPQGRARTAVVSIAVVVLSIIALLFLGLWFSRPGEGVLVIPGWSAQDQQ